MQLLPAPRNLTRLEGIFHFDDQTPILLVNTPPGSFTAASILRNEILAVTGLPLAIVRGEKLPKALILHLCTSDTLPADAAYTLDISPEGVLVRAAEEEALQWGVMTLVQLVRLYGALLPCLHIEDAPVFERRGYYQDCSRGRVPTLKQLMATADLLALFKINEWQLYVEHTYLFRNESEAWRGDTPLQAAEIMELDAYCRARHIELVPSLASFGHMQRILSTKTHEAQCELAGSDAPRFLLQDMMLHHTLNPADPESLKLAIGLIDEYRALFTSRRFNICCDETFDLGRGRSRESGQDRESLYISFVAALCSHLLAEGITPQFWGDILLRQPETAHVLPKGTVCLNWEYSANTPEKQIADIAATGLPQMVCPGISSWNRLLPDADCAWANIRAMSTYGQQYNALGLLNTDWGDFGHLCDPALATPWILCGAAFAWNPEAMTDQVGFESAASRLLYGDATGSVVSALSRLSRCALFSWWNAVCWAEAEDPDVRERHLGRIRTRAGELESAQAEMISALEDLDRAAPHLNVTGKTLVYTAHLAAQGTDLINRIGLCAAGENPEDRFALAAALETWFQAYCLRWREVSREGQLKETFRIIEIWADWLRGRVRKDIPGIL
ncbi:MAG: family 20 glycosylhydrolase [Clostridia bacterium]|nr:family 20 glycosylhydrolase [Clostridia bacterium]